MLKLRSLKSTKNPELSKAPPFKPRAGQNTAVHASPRAWNSTEFKTPPFEAHSTSFSPILLEYKVVDSELEFNLCLDEDFVFLFLVHLGRCRASDN